jgi:hypothetical protein
VSKGPLDYVIDHSARKDWATLLSAWGDLLPASFDLFLVNRFGDAVVVLSDGSVHMLDIGAGVFPRLANNLDEFIDQLPAYARNWLMIPLVDECAAAGMSLGAEQCYSYKTPPMMGGGYELANIHIAPIAEHYAFLADVHRQTRDLPDGARVSARFAQF